MTSHADGFGLIQDIDVRLTVELGRKSMRLRDVLALGESSVIELDRLTDEPLDMFVNGKLIARGLGAKGAFERQIEIGAHRPDPPRTPALPRAGGERGRAGQSRCGRAPDRRSHCHRRTERSLRL